MESRGERHGDRALGGRSASAEGSVGQAESVGQIETVAGPLPISAVRGPSLAREHLAVDARWAGGAEAVLSPAVHASRVAGELEELAEDFGLYLAVELTCRGMGRDPATLGWISERSGVAVVAAGGWYGGPWPLEGGRVPREVAEVGVEGLTELLVAEVVEGFDGLGIRPGVLGGLGSGRGAPGVLERRALAASGRAAARTGLSVVVHAPGGWGGLERLESVTGAELAPHRVCVGQQDQLGDSAAHRELASCGAYIAFDTVGETSRRGDGDRLRLLLALLEAGHADRVLLSCGVSRFGGLRSEGGRGYGWLFRSFLPALREAGADDDLVDLLTRRNPLRFLTGASVEEV